MRCGESIGGVVERGSGRGSEMISSQRASVCGVPIQPPLLPAAKVALLNVFPSIHHTTIHTQDGSPRTHPLSPVLGFHSGNTPP